MQSTLKSLAAKGFAAMAMLALVPVYANAQGTPRAASSSTAAKQLSADVAAMVGEHAISVSDVDRQWQASEGVTYNKIQQQTIEARKRALNTLVAEYLIKREAEKRKTTVDALLKQKLPGLIQAITDNEIRELYRRSPAAEQGVPYEQSKSTIEGYLRVQRIADARRRYADQLKAETTVATNSNLDIPREKIALTAFDPAVGARSAAVEIIEFSDFQCPYCRTAAPLLKRLAERYPGQVRLVWKNFPLVFHGDAKTAAEAALCVNDQNRFWEYHDILFQHQDALSPSDLKQHAAEAGVDPVAFAKCFESGRHRNDVDASVQEGRRHGISGTPTVFINGRPVVGLAPLEVYEQRIKDELGAGNGLSARQ